MSERPSNIAGTLKNSLSDADETYNAAVEAAKRVHAGYEAQTAAETKRANTDELTGLLNKAAWRRKAEERIASGEVSKKRFGVIFMDSKDFKKLNDNHGHEVGDKYLRSTGGYVNQVSDLLQHTLRTVNNDKPRDLDVIGSEPLIMPPEDNDNGAGRYGGDEFVMLVEGVEDEETLQKVIDRITTGYNEDEAIQAFGVPISIGGTVWTEGMSLEKLLTLADESMMINKRVQQAESGAYRPS